jgi:hypothetical protein
MANLHFRRNKVLIVTYLYFMLLLVSIILYFGYFVSLGEEIDLGNNENWQCLEWKNETKEINLLPDQAFFIDSDPVCYEGFVYSPSGLL